MKRISSIISKLNKILVVIFAFSIVSSSNSLIQAASNWKGYAVYRDGVFFNLNDHAALMDTENISIYLPIIHAVGSNGTVKFDHWSNFLGNNNYLGIYRPKNVSMTSTIQNSFVAKARELRGISYTVLDQIFYYIPETKMWVYPENITKLRCDGVVEYVYEWYGYRVGGADGKWDITRNLRANYFEHSGFNITPRKQRSGLLTKVSSGLPN